MKLYSVAAATVDYDEFDEFLIWAETPEQALLLAQKASSSFGSNFMSGATVNEVAMPSEPGILLGSFNAG